MDKKAKAKEPDDIEILAAQLGKLVDLHHDILTHLLHVTALIKKSDYSKEDLCDIGFLCREFESLLDDFRKDMKARKEMTGKIIAMQLMKESLSDLDATDSVKGKLARGTATLRMQAALPKQGTDEYTDLLDFFYVPRLAIGDGILKLNWKSVEEMATKLAEEGKPLPPGITKTYPVYSTIFTKLKKS